MGSGEISGMLQMKGNKSLLKNTAQYNKLLQALRNNSDIRLSIEKCKTSDKKLSNHIMDKLCKATHHSRSDQEKTSYFVNNFKVRILKDLDLHDSGIEVLAPCVKWLHFFRSYLQSILIKNHNYIKSLRKSTRIPTGVISESMNTIFGFSASNRGGNAVYYKFFQSQARRIFEEHKQMLKKNEELTISNLIDDDYDSIDECDELNRPKKWAEYFICNEENVIRSVYNIPVVIKEEDKSNQISLTSQSKVITKMTKSEASQKRVRTNSRSSEDGALENALQKRIKLSCNESYQETSQWYRTRYGMASRIIASSLIGCRLL